MSAGCKCNGRLGNTGDPNCPMIFGITSRLIFVNIYADDGTMNKIDLSTVTFNSTYITARLNDPDPSKRWYPSPGELKNVTDERGDDIYQEFDDQTKAFITEGARNFNSFTPRVDPRLYGRVKEFRCVKVGVYYIDEDGSLIGSKHDGEGTNYLYPVAISDSSLSARFIKKKGTETVQGMMIMFDVAKSERDEDLWMVRASDMVGINLLTIRGLFDVKASIVGSVTTTGFTMKLLTAYEVPVEGLVAADFYDEAGGTASRLYNITNDAAVTITSVTESNPGEYTFVFAAQTSADILRVTPVKNGFDFTDVTEVEVTIP